MLPPSHRAVPVTAGLSLLIITAAGMNLIIQQGRLQQSAAISDLIISALLILHTLLLLTRTHQRPLHQATAGLCLLLLTLTLS